MHFRINPQIFKQFPGSRIGIILATNITNKNGAESYLILQKELDSLKKKLTQETLINHSFIHAWQIIYKKMGLNPKKYRSSIENLASRAVEGKEFQSINPLVDLYNAISLKYLLPLGGENLDMMTGNLELTIASDNEKPVHLLGEKKEYKPEPGEVIYKDAQGTVCARWNWREADRTKLTAETRNAILVIDAAEIIPDALLTDATNELAHLIERHCGGTVSVAIADEKNPELLLRKNNNYVVLNKPGTVSKSAESIMDFLDVLAETKEEISAETKIRIDKVSQLRAMNIEPWPESKPVPNTTSQVAAEFEKPEQQTNYTIAGRLIAIRLHGKTAFATLQDRTGRIQIYLKQDVIPKEFDQFKQYIDIGDSVWITGNPFKTKTGEITLEVTDFALLSKCLHPLPEKFHGLADIETRYRQRYLDLISNPESKEKFIKRTNIIKEIRNYLDSFGFLEVETPMLHPIAGGAAARPFVTHHNALDTDFYLRIAPELYLKRLVVGGFERVYEINRNFRNEGISTRHNPEFTMLEFYMAHQNYQYIMNFVEDLLRTVVQKTHNALQLSFGEYILDFAKPFKKLSVKNAVLQIGKLSERDLDGNQIESVLKKYKIELENKQASHGEKIFALFEELVEEKLIEPTFITDYPIEISPLSKRDPNNPAIAARYELFIAGMEISNGFNELNDPFDQADRFKQQVEAHKAGDTEAHQFDADYVQALEYALPPTAGVGIGIDRLVMLLTNTTSIKDVILFPTLKKK